MFVLECLTEGPELLVVALGVGDDLVDQRIEIPCILLWFRTFFIGGRQQ
jgi:hypothetical protein